MAAYGFLLSVPDAGAATSCYGKNVYPSQDLASVAANSGAGTTFCIHDGTYNVSRPVDVQDKDRFVGVYDDSTRPAIVTTQALQVFDAIGSDFAVIKGLKISGAVGGNYCEPMCGRGIAGGSHLTVSNVWATGNKNQGVGGTGPGLLVENSVMDHNGSYSFARDGGPVSAAGIKSTEPMTVLNSRITDNYWNGVWCDNNCGAFTVKNSTITGNGKAGIHDEISTGPAVFSGNTIRGNGTLTSADRHSGLLIVDSSNVDAYNNAFGSNVLHGVHVIDYDRSPRVSGVKIHDNVMNSNNINSCTLYGVSCYSNR